MNAESTEGVSREELLRMSVDIVAAYVSQNQISSAQLTEIISTIFSTLQKLDDVPGDAPATQQKPAVTVRKSVTPDYIVCLEDGKKLKMLKRHLRTAYGMTPEEYRVKWNLGPEYPMVAPNYAKRRSDFAKEIGLGQKSNKKGKSGAAAKRGKGAK